MNNADPHFVDLRVPDDYGNHRRALYWVAAFWAVANLAWGFWL